MNVKDIKFLIVGCAKCGTSSLYEYICEHPEVQAASVKEPGYFVKDSLLKQNGYQEIDTWEKYLNCFPQTPLGTFTGEASVSYFNYLEESIPSIKKRLGKRTKIIIILKNPIERLISGYNYAARTGVESRTLEEVLRDWDGKTSIIDSVTNRPCYIANGLYSERVKMFFEEFDDVKVVTLEDLVKKPAKVMNEIFRFLGVAEFTLSDKYSVHNKGGFSPKDPRLTNIIFNKNYLVKFIRKRMPYNGKVRKASRKLRTFTERFLMKKSVYIETVQLNETLNNFYLSDIEQLENFLDIDLTDWR